MTTRRASPPAASARLPARPLPATIPTHAPGQPAAASIP